MNKKTGIIFIVCLAAFMLFGSTAGAEWYVMKPGDNLWTLAANKYGDGNLYTVLSNYNSISNPRAIPVGQKIWMPDKAELIDFRDAETEEDKEDILRQGRNDQDSSLPPSTGTGHVETVPFILHQSILDDEVPMESTTVTPDKTQP